jgi:predicted MFS family arabinose efflux permease
MTGSAQPLPNSAKLGILLAATIAIAIGGMQTVMLGAMIKPLGDAYGWSRGDVGFALTISHFILPFANIAVGVLADNFPVRRIVLPGIFSFAICTALLGLINDEIWTWYLGYAVVSLATAGISSVLFTKLIVEHFSKRRGIALATSLSGAGLMFSVTPHIVLLLEKAVGIHGVYPTVAACAFVILIIPCWLFLPRENLALHRPALAAFSSRMIQDVVSSTLLWRMLLGFLLIGLCVGTFIVHLQPILTDAGLSRVQAASVALFVGPAMIAGRLGIGALYDLLPTRLVTALAFALPALACSWLILFPLDFASASVLAVLIGLGLGSETDVVAYLSSRYFGTHQYGLVFSILISIYGFGIGIASWLGGKAYDSFGGYGALLLALSGGVVIAITLIMSLGPPPHKPGEE